MKQLSSWTIFSIAVVIAAASWGAYAWRHARVADPEDAASSLASAPTDALEKDALVSLRAARPAYGTTARTTRDDEAEDVLEHDSDGFDPVSRVVSANAPPTSVEPIEMTLSRQAATPPAPTGEITQAARAALARGELIEARRLLTEALTGDLATSDAATVRSELVRIADALLFSRATNTPDPTTDVYDVAPGDTLYGIARKYHITEDLLAAINGLDDPNRLRVGQRLKVIRGPFHASISKTHHRMDIYLADILVRSYRVGLGTNGGTPTGTWAVNTKLKNPDWTDPITNQHYLADDPDNPIGERWIGLEGLGGEAVGKVGFGIHGTIDPSSIGENMSLGCIRMLAEDVAEVYDLLVDRHSRVVVHP